ncbi:MAG TPA: glycosyltransferase, partial [Pirellulales bacterium]
MLKSSLSVVLPVCNDQAHLARRLSSLLEVLPEVAGRFEMAVIDHGSSDATAEVAHDLAASYPQVCVLSYPRPLDGSSVLR